MRPFLTGLFVFSTMALTDYGFALWFERFSAPAKGGGGVPLPLGMVVGCVLATIAVGAVHTLRSLGAIVLQRGKS